MHELGPFRFHPYLAQEPPHRANTDLRPVVALAQTAFSLRTRDHEQAACARLERVKEVLGVRLAAAGEFLYLNVDAALRPLTRQTPALGNALATYENGNVWM